MTGFRGTLCVRKWHMVALLTLMPQFGIAALSDVRAAAFCMSDAEIQAYSWEALSEGLDVYFWACENEFGERLALHYSQLRTFRKARKAYLADGNSTLRQQRRSLALQPFERGFPGQGREAFQVNLKRDAEAYQAGTKLTLDTCKKQLGHWGRAIEKFGLDEGLARFALMSVAANAALNRRPLPKCRD